MIRYTYMTCISMYMIYMCIYSDVLLRLVKEDNIYTFELSLFYPQHFRCAHSS